MSSPLILSPGSEWRPFQKPLEAALEEDLNKLSENVRRETESLKRNIGISEDRLGLCRGERLCEDVIVDPLAFYVPYSFHPDKWGIYFRVNRMLEAFRRVVGWYWNYMGIIGVEGILVAWTVFVEYVYWHELTHHIVEDIATLKKISYRTILARDEEEGLAEWHAFNTASRWTSDAYIPAGVELLATPSSPPEGVRVRALARDYRFRERVLTAIYYAFGRDTDPVYKPIVRKRVVQELGDHWPQVKHDSVAGRPVHLYNGEEVYQRIYTTDI